MSINRQLECQILDEIIERIGKGEYTTHEEYTKGVAERGLKDELRIIREVANAGIDPAAEKPLMCDDCIARVIHEVVDEFFKTEPPLYEILRAVSQKS